MSIFKVMIRLLDLSENLLKDIEKSIQVLLYTVNEYQHQMMALSSFIFLYRNLERPDIINNTIVSAFEEEADGFDEI